MFPFFTVAPVPAAHAHNRQATRKWAEGEKGRGPLGQICFAGTSGWLGRLAGVFKPPFR